MHTQLVVIGGGPGGYAAAFLAADHGLSVTIVESASRLGGTCLLRGCIPSKALLHVAKAIGEVNDLSGHWGVNFGDPQVDLDALRGRKEQVIADLSGGLKQLAKRRKVTVLQARATFENANTLQLQGTSDSLPEDGKLTFDQAILATGSQPAMPRAFAIGSERVMDSRGALELPEIPGSLLVIGGGYIGLELGTVFSQLGSDVSVVELTPQLLPGVDADLVKPLQRRLTKLFGDRIFLNTRVGSLTDRGSKVEVTFEL